MKIRTKVFGGKYMIKITIDIIDEDTKNVSSLSRNFADVCSLEALGENTIEMVEAIKNTNNWNGSFKVDKL